MWFQEFRINKSILTHKSHESVNKLARTIHCTVTCNLRLSFYSFEEEVREVLGFKPT